MIVPYSLSLPTKVPSSATGIRLTYPKPVVVLSMS